MYLIKQKVKSISAQKLDPNDVISINKIWYVVREKLELDDELKLTGLRCGKRYTIEALKAFGAVTEFKKVGIIVEDEKVEELSIDMISVNKKVSKA